jgi:hypothetical protein
MSFFIHERIEKIMHLDFFPVNNRRLITVFFPLYDKSADPQQNDNKNNGQNKIDLYEKNRTTAAGYIPQV